MVYVVVYGEFVDCFLGCEECDMFIIDMYFKKGDKDKL